MKTRTLRMLALMMSGLLAAAAGTVEAKAAEAVEAAKESADEQMAVVEISSAEELAAVAENLSGNYVLMADIDLEGKEWTPIGSFVQMGQEGEEAETPDPEAAFTGTFDGNGHTISNLRINQPEGWCVGLFGCIANAEVGNFTVKDAETLGTTMVSDVVGYSYCSTVYDVALEEGKVNVNPTEISAEGMYGGIVGAGMDSRIVHCTAQADITIPEGTANAGIVGGGLEMTSVYNCTAEGTVTAANNCYGLGGISGCGFAAEAFMGNETKNVTITAGDDCFWIGGITGYCGGYEDESFGMPVTLVIDCRTEGTQINAGANAEGVNDIVGAGFYNEQAAQTMGAPFDRETVYKVLNCSAE